MSFNKFELPHPEEDNCCSWKVHSLPNHDLLAESNFWWYLQLISATISAYRSTGTCCAPKTCSSHFRRSLISPNWMVLSPRRTLDVYTERIPPSLCLRGWVLGWIHSVHPWELLTLHQGTEPSTSELCMNLDPSDHCFKSTQQEIKNNQWKLIQTFHQTLVVKFLHKP